MRAARNSDRSPRSHVASRKGARSASGMQSCWLDNNLLRVLLSFWILFGNKV